MCCGWIVMQQRDESPRRLDLLFFFQAEDGIRDKLVTGVQTCALPISLCRRRSGGRRRSIMSSTVMIPWSRSEERRVGKSVDLGGRRIIKKKKKKTYRLATTL